MSSVGIPQMSEALINYHYYCGFDFVLMPLLFFLTSVHLPTLERCIVRFDQLKSFFSPLFSANFFALIHPMRNFIQLKRGTFARIKFNLS